MAQTNVCSDLDFSGVRFDPTFRSALRVPGNRKFPEFAPLCAPGNLKKFGVISTLQHKLPRKFFSRGSKLFGKYKSQSPPFCCFCHALSRSCPTNAPLRAPTKNLERIPLRSGQTLAQTRVI